MRAAEPRSVPADAPPRFPAAPEPFADFFVERFGVEPEIMREPAGGRVRLAVYPRGRVATVATLGLAQEALEDGSRIELVCTVLTEHVAAAELGVRIAVRRILGEFGRARAALAPGDAWINTQPYVAGTSIQGIVAIDGAWDGRDTTVRDASGRRAGAFQEILLLTATEAKRVAHDGLGPLRRAALEHPGRLYDMLREDLVPPPVMVPDVPCIVTAALHECEVGWMQRDASGAWLASTGSESPEYLADAANFEQWRLANVVAGTPELRDFALTARPGEYLMREGGGWVRGRFDGA